MVIHLKHYNFAQIHKTLRVTPAMERAFPIMSGRSKKSHVWQNSGMPSAIMRTWTGAKEFKYSGQIGEGLKIHCGKGFSRLYTMTASELREALTEFSGREVKIGTHRTAPPDGSIGDWMRRKFRKGGIMSYLGPILIEEGWASRGSEADLIRIKSFSN